MDRNNTSYPLHIIKKLTDLYAQWQSSNSRDNLKYYQYLVVNILLDPSFDNTSRGILVYHTMGMGKTRVMSAVATECAKMPGNRKIILLIPNGLKSNFETTLRTYVTTTGNIIPEITYATMDAYNSEKQIPDLDDSLLMVEEAHNFFRSIINGGKNARIIYERIMQAKNLKIVFFTGTPCSKDPFEIVPCVNMCVGYSLLPVQYEVWRSQFINDEGTEPKNTHALLNMLMGLVSHVSHNVHTIPIGEENDDPIDRDIVTDSNFPEELPTIIKEIEMSEPQYHAYLMARQKEMTETKSYNNNLSSRLLLPSAERSGGSTYYVKSRTISDYYSNSNTYTEIDSPKLWTAANLITHNEGLVIVYSQFITNGLLKLGSYLEERGWALFNTKKLNERSIDNTMEGGGNGYTYKQRARSPRVSNVREIHYSLPTKFKPITCDIDKLWIDPDYIDVERIEIKKRLSDPKFYSLYDISYEIEPGIHYIETSDHNRKVLDVELNLHHGQRKLLLTLVSFLNRFPRDRELICVYAGAAPGSNIPFVSDLFPNITWHLYDPNDFDTRVRSHLKMTHTQDFFTDDVATSWTDKCDLFISDIRLSIEDRDEFNASVANDTQMQERWVTIIRPRLGAMLKFRPSYVTDTLTSHMTTTLKGDIEIQAWPPTRSSETRIIVGAAPPAGTLYEMMTFQTIHYDNFMYLHNIIDRNWITYDVVDESCSWIPGYDRCYDCTYEALIWKRYDSSAKVSTLMNAVTHHLHQRLNMPRGKSMHGIFPDIPRCECRHAIYKLSTLNHITGGGATDVPYVVGVDNFKYPITYNQTINKHWFMNDMQYRTRFLAIIDFIVRNCKPKTTHNILCIDGDANEKYDNGIIFYRVSQLFTHIRFTIVSPFKKFRAMSKSENVAYINEISKINKDIAYHLMCILRPMNAEMVNLCDSIMPSMGILCTQNTFVPKSADELIPLDIDITRIDFEIYKYKSYEFVHAIWMPGIWHHIMTKNGIIMDSDDIRRQCILRNIMAPYHQYGRMDPDIQIKGFDECFDCTCTAYIMKSMATWLDNTTPITKLIQMCALLSGNDIPLLSQQSLHGLCGNIVLMKKKLILIQRIYGGGNNVSIHRLATATPDVAEKLLKIVNMDEVKPYVSDGNGWTEEKLNELISYDAADMKSNNANNAQWYITSNDDVVGYISIRPTKSARGAVQYRIFVDPSFHGNGIGTAALKQVIPLFNTIVGNIKRHNKASEKMAINAGLTLSHLRSEYGPSYNVYMIQSSAQPIHRQYDTFPYRKYFITSVNTMWDNLGNDIQSENIGGAIVVSRTFPEQFNSCDSISDHFAERVRISCYENGKPSPIDVWSRMKEAQIKQNWRINPEECERLREVVYNKTRGCNLFNASLAFFIYNRYMPKDVAIYRIIDPAAGWGDRLLAAMKMNASYIGFDTNPQLQSVYNEEIEFATNHHSSSKEVRVICEPYELYKGGVIELAHTILVSPPFYDQEIYEGEKTSTALYKGRQTWMENYYYPMIDRSHALLELGGHFILYIPPNLIDATMEYISTTNIFTYVERIEFQQIVGDTPAKYRTSLVFKKTEDTLTFWKDGNKKGGKDESAHTHEGYKYAIISGDVPLDERNHIMKAFNSVENIDGDVIKCLLVSKTGVEGIDTKCVTTTIAIEPFFDIARMEQFKARAIRMGAHERLPPERRKVQPYILVSTHNEKLWKTIPQASREDLTIDQILLEAGKKKYALCEKFRDLLKQVCFECGIFGYSNCRICQPTGVKLFTRDYSKNITHDPCVPYTKEIVKVDTIILGDTTYKYRLDDKKYVFYEYRKEYKAWAPVTDEKLIDALRKQV